MATIIGGGSGCPQRKNWDISDIFINILGYGTVLGIIAFPIFLLEIDKPAQKLQKEPSQKIENVTQRKEIIKNDTVYMVIGNNTHNIR